MDPRMKIIDMSRYQTSINYRLIKESGLVELAICKVSQGATITDPQFSAHYVGWRGVGVRVAAYHWVTRKESAESQLANLLRSLNNRTVDFIALDIEEKDLALGDQYSNIGRAMAEALVGMGYKVVIYTNAYVIKDYARKLAEWVGDYPLWWAQWPIGGAKVECDWETFWSVHATKNSGPSFPLSGYTGPREWAFWQFTGDKYVLPGMNNTASDVNYFNGDFSDYLRWLGIEDNGVFEVSEDTVFYILNDEDGLTESGILPMSLKVEVDSKVNVEFLVIGKVPDGLLVTEKRFLKKA